MPQPDSVTACIKAVLKQLRDKDIALRDADGQMILDEINDLAASSANGMPVSVQTLERLVAQARNKLLANAHRKRLNEAKMLELDAKVKLHAATPQAQFRAVVESLAQIADTELPNPFQMPTYDRMFSESLDAKRKTAEVFDAYKKKHPHVDLHHDEAKLRSILMYAAGRDGGDLDVKPIGDHYRQTMAELAARAKKAGSTEGWLPNYLPRDTDAALATTLTHKPTDEYAQFLRDNLDPAWHDDIEASIVALWKGQTDHQMFNDLDASVKGSGSGTRMMHLKTTEADVEYIMRFSKHDALTLLDNYIERRTKSIVMHEDWGTNGISNMVALVEKTKQRAMDAAVTKKDIAAVNKLSKQADRRIAAMRGLGTEVKNDSISAVESLAFAHSNAANLGRVIISQAFDVVNNTWNLQALKGSFVHGRVQQALANWQTVSDATKRALIERQAFLHTSLMGHVSSRYVPAAAYQTSSVGLRAVNGVALATKGLNGITSLMMRFGGADALSNALNRQHWNTYTGMLADAAMEGIQFRDLDGWNPEFARRLRESGVTEQSFNAVVHPQHVVGDDAIGWRTIDFDAVGDMRARSEIMSFIGREAAFGVSRPDLMSRYYAGQLSQRGTALGMAWRIAMQYQAMQMGVIRTTMLRAARGGVVSMASLAAPLFAVGLMKVQFDQWASDQPLYKPDASLLYTAALDRSNIMGFVGSMIHSGNEARIMRGEVDPFEIVGNSMGPLAGNITRFGKVSSAAAFGDNTARSEQQLAKFVWANTPGHNFVATTHWLPHLMNAFYDDLYVAPNRRKMEYDRGLYER